MAGSNKLFLILENIVLFLVIFLITFSLPYNPDLGWHLRNGQVILEQGSVVRQDLFSHTLPGFEFVNHSWLTDVFLFSVYSRFGLVGIGVFSSLVLACTLLIVLVALRASIFSSLFSLVIFWFLIGSEYRGFQAQFISLFFLSLVLVVWKKGMVEKKKLLALPLLFLFWANCHGGAPIGLMALFILIGSRFFWVFGGKKKRRKEVFLGDLGFYGLVFLGCCFATLFNPSGVKYWENFFVHLTDAVQREYIVEWRSLDLRSITGAAFLLSFLAGLVAGLKLFSESPAYFLLALFFGLSGFFVRRNLLFWALYFPFLVGWWLKSGRFPIKVSLDSRVRVGLALLVLVFSLAFSLPRIKQEVGVENNWKEYCSRVPTFCPAGAVEFLSGVEMKGKMFNLYSWGGFLTWRLSKYPVFVDGRMATWQEREAYPFWEEEQVIRLRPGWEEILAKYGVDWAVIPANPYSIGGEEYDLASALGEKEWKEIYRDEIASVLKR